MAGAMVVHLSTASSLMVLLPGRHLVEAALPAARTCARGVDGDLTVWSVPSMVAHDGIRGSVGTKCAVRAEASSAAGEGSGCESRSEQNEQAGFGNSRNGEHVKLPSLSVKGAAIFRR